MLNQMEANHVRRGLNLMYQNANGAGPTKWDFVDKPAVPLVYCVNDQLTAQYVNDQLANPNGTKCFVGQVTINLHQGGANGVIFFYDPYGNITLTVNELPNIANTPPRDFSNNYIMSKLEVSVTWATKFSLNFFGYLFEYKPL